MTVHMCDAVLTNHRRRDPLDPGKHRYGLVRRGVDHDHRGQLVLPTEGKAEVERGADREGGAEARRGMAMTGTAVTTVMVAVVVMIVIMAMVIAITRMGAAMS